jgi:hypothetical protein
MKIKALRILPPIAIGRLGSASEPLVNYEIEEDPQHPLDFHRVKGATTFVVDPGTGEIVKAFTPKTISFKEVEADGTERIRPVAPFLEVWALVDRDQLVPLTVDLLRKNGLKPADVKWQVTVANRKVSRRTANKDDEVSAKTPVFSTHEARRLEGHCKNFISDKASIYFGRVQFIKPTEEHPEIRLRFTPGPGDIYGPNLTDDEARSIYGPKPTGDVAQDKKQKKAKPPVWIPPRERAIYDWRKGWLGFENFKPIKPKRARKPSDLTEVGEPEVKGVELERLQARETLPPSLYSLVPPGPCWLNDNVAVSRGYFDDTCDGIVEVRLKLKSGKKLEAAARISSGPPAVVPDTVFLRTLRDDLEQVIYGPWVPPGEKEEATRDRALNIIRRAFDAVRFLNVAVMNGNPVNGRKPLDFDTMPAEEAFDVQRMMRPVVPERTADTLMIMNLHQQVYAALQGGAAPWFAHVLRLPTEVGDFTDHGRRKMPAMMCGADGGYLALTYRQINAILRCSGLPLQPKHPKKQDKRAGLIARNRFEQITHVAAGNPVNSRLEMSVGNCTPGLEMDFRAVWRRLFEGIVLREYDNLVTEMDPSARAAGLPNLAGHRLLRVNGENMFTQMIGPSPANTRTRTTVLGFTGNPDGVAPLEWSNALARVLHESVGKTVTCYFTKTPVWSEQALWESEASHLKVSLKVRPFFEDDTAMISRVLAKPGELTQGLCSPWQNDYRECSCYYWASARPDFVNVQPDEAGLSVGDNWMQKERTGDYVPDDYVDSRLLNYDDLFLEWEKFLRFQIGGVDQDKSPPAPPSASLK